VRPRPELLTLEAFCRDHLARIEREVTVVESVRAQAEQGELPHLRAAASGLHSFYTGVEAVLERIADGFEGRPTGLTSHDRLRSAAFDLPGIRPPVLARATVDELDAYRSFRHFFRHAYGVDLDYERMRAKVERIRQAYERVHADLDGFGAFLVTAARLQPEPARDDPARDEDPGAWT
jgi:hypothetical protein